MFQIIKKQEQLNAKIFDGNFIVNKPVSQGASAMVAPYSNLFYWSHARAVGPVEFGLHGHSGFEIMTFVWEGENAHYDTETKRWTDLHAGNFQVIKSGSGLQHAEKIISGTRSFQIWFDPNFEKTLSLKPAYKDYNRNNWQEVIEEGHRVHYYVGGNSPADYDTEGLIIKTFKPIGIEEQQIKLKSDCNYHFYQLYGQSLINGQPLTIDDILKTSGIETLNVQLSTDSELFVIQTQRTLSYRTSFS